VRDEEIEEQLRAMQQDQGEWAPLEEEGAAYEDMLSMKLQGTSGEETVIEDEAFELILSEEGEDFPPGFDAQFVGKQAGDQVAFDITYPEDWPSERAGEAAHFEAEILSVKRHDVPELDDDFAPLVGDYDTLDELRESIGEGMLEERLSASEHEYANQVVDQVIENAVRIEYPPVLVENFLDQMVEEQASELQRSGLPFDEFLRMTGQSREAYRERLREIAESRLKGDLVLGELVELERIEATDEEIDKELEELLEGSGNPEGMREMLSSEGGRAALAQQITRRKAIDRLMAIADGTAPELPSDEPDDEDAVIDSEKEPSAEPQS
jgi:trigger factor